MQIRIDTKYEYNPLNNHIKVLCSVLENGEVKLSSIIAKPSIENFEEDLNNEVAQKYAQHLSLEVEKRKNVEFVATLSEGNTFELRDEKVDTLVAEIVVLEEEKKAKEEELKKIDKQLDTILEDVVADPVSESDLVEIA